MWPRGVMLSSALSRSSPVGPFSAHALAGAGRLWLLRLYPLIGLDVSAVEGDSAAQPIHHAAYNGETEVVAWLVDACAVHAAVCTADGWQPMHCSAAGGYAPTVAWLLERARQSPDVRTLPDGLTPLMCAALHGHARVARLLVDAHCDVSARSAAGHTALHLAAAGGSAAVVRLLLSLPHCVDVDAVDAQGRTALHAAARRGRDECVRALLAAGASPALTDTLGLDALTMAAMRGWTRSMDICRCETERRGSATDLARLLDHVGAALRAAEDAQTHSRVDGEGRDAVAEPHSTSETQQGRLAAARSLVERWQREEEEQRQQRRQPRQADMQWDGAQEQSDTASRARGSDSPCSVRLPAPALTATSSPTDRVVIEVHEAADARSGRGYR